jgi:hypothetical protein
MLDDVSIGPDANQMWDGANKIGEKLSWKDVSRELVKRRLEMQKRVEKLDMDDAKKAVIKAFHIDKSTITDKP